MTDRGIVDGPDRLPTARAFDGSLETQRLVLDVQGTPANRAFHLCGDVVEFVRHVTLHSSGEVFLEAAVLERS